MASNNIISIHRVPFLAKKISKHASLSKLDSKIASLKSQAESQNGIAINNLIQQSNIECKPTGFWLDRSSSLSLNRHILDTHLLFDGHTLKMNMISKRFKKTKSRSSKIQEEDEEDDDEDIDDEKLNALLSEDLRNQVKDDCQRQTLDIASLRLDAVGKIAFNVTRQKIEELFYKGSLYVNGEKAIKKGQDLHLDDQIDLIMQVNAEDRTKVDIKRIVIVGMPDKATEQGRMKITIDKWNNLTIDRPDEE